MMIAFQGEHGAYSEAAALAYFGEQAETTPCESFDRVFELVEAGICDYGMIPIENSLAGSIHRNYDLLLRHQLSIVGEYPLRVQHCLIGLPGAELSKIQRVVSHPQALAQCEAYLRSLPGVVSEAAYDTAGSVQIIRQRGDPTQAAIASRRAAQVYGTFILAEGIEDDPSNYTRFLAIAKEAPASSQDSNAGSGYKTSIVFSLANQPGSLFKALSVFALREIDLTKIESRPLVGRPWEYLFYIDFVGSIAQEPVARALGHLAEYATTLRVLGSYPRHPSNHPGG